MDQSLQPGAKLGNKLADHLFETRAQTLALARPLTAEDQQVQSMPDVSPTKWHLAHTTWFFETFVLAPNLPGYRAFDARFGYLFNSYYEAVGDRQPRAERGLLSRPSLEDVLAYRAHVEEGLRKLERTAGWAEASGLIELGLHHEQQHQELILMDIKHVLSRNPIEPAYRPPHARAAAAERPVGWIEHGGGLIEIGHGGPEGGGGFAFDNEGPRHKVYLAPYALADRLATNGDVLAFILDGGYRRPELWLSDGWAAVKQFGWSAPLYWRHDEEAGWSQFTLCGRREIDWAEPACHLSHYEADAYARWAGARLPTEAEWEAAAPEPEYDGGRPRVRPAGGGAGFYGEVWQWTASAYLAYPGYRPDPGAVGEYNGKFMSGQMVLKGSACITPAGHARRTYRNFFPPGSRWMYAGLRLAADR